MSERKAINKYYPPDYDPSKIKKVKKNPHQIIKIRMMAPYSMRCTNCNEYIAERRSFNAKKEPTSEKYLSIRIIRFYIYCPRCNNVITFKTNPQTAGYTPELGAVRNFEPKKATSNAPEHETEDELFSRLEKEHQENATYQTLKEKRKKNPFWQSNDSTSNDVMDNFQNRLQQQIQQQQITEHLESLHEKYSTIAANGGSDKLVDEAVQKLHEQKNDDDQHTSSAFEKDKAQANEKLGPRSILPKPDIQSKITIKKKTPSKLPNVKQNDKVVSQTTVAGYSSSEDDDDD